MSLVSVMAAHRVEHRERDGDRLRRRRRQAARPLDEGDTAAAEGRHAEPRDARLATFQAVQVQVVHRHLDDVIV